MDNGVPWRVKGVRPDARDTAREAARRAGMSVGDWLNSVILEQAQDEGVEPVPAASVREDEERYSDDAYQTFTHRLDNLGQQLKDVARNNERGYQGGDSERIASAIERLDRRIDQLANSGRPPIPAVAPRAAAPVTPRPAAPEPRPAATLPRVDLYPEPRMSTPSAAPLAPPMPPSRPMPSFTPTLDPNASAIDRAVAEIAARQVLLDTPAPGSRSQSAPAYAPPAEPAPRMSPPEPIPYVAPPVQQAPRPTPPAYAYAAVEAHPPVYAPEPPAPPPPTVAAYAPPRPSPPRPAAPPRPPSRPDVLPRPATQDLSGLERQLRSINSQIEALRQEPHPLDGALTALRSDLAQISQEMREALPRQAIDTLEHDVRALSERVNASRQSGVDTNALVSVESALSEIRDALHELTPAEGLGMLQLTIEGLAHKIDALGNGESGGQDPAAVQQLEQAIATLRGITTHIASHDAVAQLTQEVQALAQKVDALARGGMGGGMSGGGEEILSTIDRRISHLADAFDRQASEDPSARFEAVVRGLNEKLELLALTRGDNIAVGALEDRIGKLVQKLDASDARLSHLEAIERALAELLVQLEHQRAQAPFQVAAPYYSEPPAAPEMTALSRDVAEIRHSEERTLDSLEAAYGTIDHVVDRLAQIEDNMRRAPEPIEHFVPAMPPPPPRAPAPPQTPRPVVAAPPAPIEPPPTPKAAHRPIDPSLPPDHPLEPGLGPAPERASPSARIAASEAALGGTKPPVIPDPGNKGDFIAAARRAAHAASMTAAADRASNSAAPRTTTSAQAPMDEPNSNFSKRLRSFFVGASVVVIVVGSLQMTASLFGPMGDSSPQPNGTPRPQSDAPPPKNTASNTPLPLASPAKAPAASPAATSLPNAPGRTDPGARTKAPGSAALPSPDVTGAISETPLAPPPTAAVAAVPMLAPPSVAAPAVRPPEPAPAETSASALTIAVAAGDPAALYEAGARYLEGRGVPYDAAQALQLLTRASEQGVIPAKFRLGGLYEKGIGVKKNLETARRLYQTAAEAGNAKAMHNLAVIYAEGIDGKPDYTHAIYWFREAAERGIMDSQFNLGVLYARGIGVDQDIEEAYKWFALAAAGGDHDAARKRDEIAAKLEPEDLTTARQAVQTFRPKPQPAAATDVRSPPGGWDRVASQPAASAEPPAARPPSVKRPAGKASGARGGSAAQ